MLVCGPGTGIAKESFCDYHITNKGHADILKKSPREKLILKVQNSKRKLTYYFLSHFSFSGERNMTKWDYEMLEKTPLWCICPNVTQAKAGEF